MSKFRIFLLPLLVVAALFAAAWPYRDVPSQVVTGRKSAGPLAAARSWHYQLDNIDVARLAATPADVMVIDYAKAEGKVPLTREDVARIKAGPKGAGRTVLAYLSIGEAEEYRFYWQDAWKKSPPDWLGEENCAWPKAHRVRYWLAGWRDINFAGPNSYLRKIVDAGFDGVYLDRIDIYETFEKERPTARAEMVDYIRRFAYAAWRLHPGFYIIPQNAEALLDISDYRSVVDGIAKESLFHGLAATGHRNTPLQIEQSARLLHKLQREGKPVFVVEYLTDARNIQAADREMRGRALIPTFQTRALDGRGPIEPVILNEEIGTPERTAKECAPGTSW